jgi:putative protease
MPKVQSFKNEDSAMRAVTYIESFQQLQDLISCGQKFEAIFAHRKLSRYGKLEFEEIYKCTKLARENGIKTILEWDVLNTSDNFLRTEYVLQTAKLDQFDAIRVQDPGALEYLLEKTNSKIQLILENGNHNLLGIQTWVDYVGNRLDRIILSIELPKDKLKEYAQKLKVDIEFYILGQILIFYTPRNLLSALYEDHDDQLGKSQNKGFLMAQGESEESPHKGFPLVENEHGTFMFHVKDQCLLEHIEELTEFGISHVRLDLRRTGRQEILTSLLQLTSSFDLQKAKDLKVQYSRDVIKGYYNVNKSDVLFPKLKNHRIQRKDENFLGHVVEVNKNKYMVVELKSKNTQLKKGDELKVITPEGKEKSFSIDNLKDVNMNHVDTIDHGDLALLKFQSGIVPMSVVYRS